MEIETSSVEATTKINLLISEIEKVIKGKRAQIEKVITCFLAGGHILMEDNPGTGKTVLARAVAQTISDRDASSILFKRIQFTPDLLPMDLIGSHIFDEQNKSFIFEKRPLFCHVLLADEINRASPKVQSALLECMAENQITVGDTTYALENPFFCMATQNPIEMEGTYPLPAAQLDRFFMKIYFGYVDEETELEIYQTYQNIAQNLIQLQPVLTKEEILQLKKDAENVFVHEEIIRSVSQFIRSTRTHPDIKLGGSIRSGIALLKCLKAYALVKQRRFVIEDDFVDLASSVISHRLIFRNNEGKQNAVETLVQKEKERLAKLKLY